MRISIALLLTAAIVSSLCAQESRPEPGAAGMDATATPSPIPSGTMGSGSSEKLRLIPDAPNSVPKPSGNLQGSADSQPSLSDAKEKLNKSKATADADELKVRIHFREVKTQALKAPGLEEKLDRARSAKTIPEKISAMKQYYDLLFARMQLIDPTLKPRIEKSKTEALARLEIKAKADLNPSARGKYWDP